VEVRVSAGNHPAGNHPAGNHPAGNHPAGSHSTGRVALATRSRVPWRVLVGVVVVGALLLAGCTDQTGDPAKQVSSWMSSSNTGTAIGQVEVDSQNVDLALRKHDPSSQLKTVCALLSTDALTAIGNLPSPDSTLTDDLNTAFEDAAAAGSSCYDGASGKATLLRRSARDRTKLVPLLDAAVDRVQAVTGHVPSTSTTLAPNGCDDPFGC
jgi:hypothetical protein